MEGQAFARALAKLRSQVEGSPQSDFSRADILALLDEAEQPQQQQHHLQSQQHNDEQPEALSLQPLPPLHPPPPPPEQFSFPAPPHPHQTQRDPQQLEQTPPAVRSPAFPSPVRNLRESEFKAHPQCRASISTVSTCSDHDSVFTSPSARSSMSLTTQSGDSKFWCTSCDKTFKRKFDWKRHEEEFHERWRKYPCPNCNQSFWGPNTFNQHHKSAHGCKTCPHSDTVVKYMRKRKAWGCGFCAAMHGKFEKHIDHVAAHFEAGSTKTDWLHSNVVYGLLHQHVLHEAWKAMVTLKDSKFNGCRPMFSWSPESTGRAQGFVENENPGQLQDFLEFFDGSKESADKIVRHAWATVHVVLNPVSPSSQGVANAGHHLVGNSHKHVPITSLQPRDSRRGAPYSAVSAAKRAIKRTASSDEFAAHQKATPSSEALPTVVVSPPLQQHNLQQQQFPQPQEQMSTQTQQFAQPNPYSHPINPAFNFFPAPQSHGRMVSLDKALPPAPMGNNVSPMNMEFPIYENTSSGLLMDSEYTPTDSWHSPAPTLTEDHPMNGTSSQAENPMYAPTGYPMGWGGMGQFGTEQ